VGEETEAAAAGGKGQWRGRLALAGAALVGAAAVGVGWLVFGGSDSGSVASFQVSPGIPPVLFDYLDNVHIASYLAQLQGGAATSGSLSQESTSTKNASVGANGAGLGASASRQSAAQLSLTVTDQSRFTSLLGLLQANGYLHAIDMGAANAVVKREFAAVTPGSFVKLSNCTLALPSYVQAEQLWRASKGRIGVRDALQGDGHTLLESITANEAARDRAVAQGKNPPPVTIVGGATIPLSSKSLAQARSQMNQLVHRVGPNPRVPLSSCSANGYNADVPDLLMPIRLGGFSSSQSSLAGRLTLVGKVVLVVDNDAPDYVDLASLQQWAGADFWTRGPEGLSDDATVLAPGYVVQPIAVYK
jgi:hypothetical protein